MELFMAANDLIILHDFILIMSLSKCYVIGNLGTRNFLFYFLLPYSIKFFERPHPRGPAPWASSNNTPGNSPSRNFPEKTCSVNMEKCSQSTDVFFGLFENAVPLRCGQPFDSNHIIPTYNIMFQFFVLKYEYGCYENIFTVIPV